MPEIVFLVNYACYHGADILKLRTNFEDFEQFLNFLNYEKRKKKENKKEGKKEK